DGVAGLGAIGGVFAEVVDGDPAPGPEQRGGGRERVRLGGARDETVHQGTGGPHRRHRVLDAWRGRGREQRRAQQPGETAHAGRLRRNRWMPRAGGPATTAGREFRVAKSSVTGWITDNAAGERSTMNARLGTR